MRQRRADQGVRAAEAPEHAQAHRSRAWARGPTTTGGRLMARTLPGACEHARRCWPPTAPPAPTRPSATRAATTARAWRATSGASRSRVRRRGGRHPGHQPRPRRAGRGSMASLATHPEGRVVLGDAWRGAGRAPRGLRRRAGGALRATDEPARTSSLDDAALDVALRRPARAGRGGPSARSGRPRARAGPQPVLAPVAARRSRRGARALGADAGRPRRRDRLRREELGRGRDAAGVVVGPGRTASTAPTSASPSPAAAPGSAPCGCRRRRSWSRASATRSARRSGRRGRCASTSAPPGWRLRGGGIEVEGEAAGAPPHAAARAGAARAPPPRRPGAAAARGSPAPACDAAAAAQSTRASRSSPASSRDWATTRARPAPPPAPGARRRSGARTGR